MKPSKLHPVIQLLIRQIIYANTTIIQHVGAMLLTQRFLKRIVKKGHRKSNGTFFNFTASSGKSGLKQRGLWPFLKL